MLTFAVDLSHYEDAWVAMLFMPIALILLLAIVLFLTVIFGSPKDGRNR
jgi:hypothetical protein